MDVLAILVVCKPYAEIALFCIMLVFGSARGSIATVSEIMQTGSTMNDEQALQKASDLMGKWLPFLPVFVRKWLIQMAFDSMKKAASKPK